METTEKIVEAYCHYVKGWFTIPGIKCHGPGQNEIDFLAIDPQTYNRYHIECSISISGTFSKLTDKPLLPEKLKGSGKVAQRRTIEFFIKHKFTPSQVLSKLKEYGFDFEKQNYTKVIVTWGWTDEAKTKADKEKIVLWNFPNIMMKIAEICEGKKTYFTNDILRTINLFLHTNIRREQFMKEDIEWALKAKP